MKLEAIIEADGSVGTVRVIEPLDPELDANAVAAARQWRFEPGTESGRPVAVLVTLELSFKTY